MRHKSALALALLIAGPAISLGGLANDNAPSRRDNSHPDDMLFGNNPALGGVVGFNSNQDGSLPVVRQNDS